MNFYKTTTLSLTLTLGLSNLLGCAAAQAPQADETSKTQTAQAPALKEPDPQNADELYAYAEALERQGQEDKAIGFYLQATQINPDHLKSHLALAQLYTKFNRSDEAKIACESILRLDREHPYVAQYKEARLKYYSALNIAQNEEYEKALQLLQQAPRNTPLDKEIDDASQKWKTQLEARARERKSDEILQQASLLAYKGNYKDALALLKTAPDAERNPTLVARAEQWNKAWQEQQKTVQPLGPGGQTPEPTPPGVQTRLINAEQAHIRQSPYLYAESVALLKRGTSVEILMDKAYESDGYQWSKVRTREGKTGWVAASLLATSLTAQPATPPPTAPPIRPRPKATPAPSSLAVTGQRTVTADHVNLRRSPSTSGTPVAALMKGSSVQLLADPPVQADQHQWLHIRAANGQEGWVAASFLGETSSRLPAAPAQKPPRQESTRMVSVSGSDINVRSQPSTQAEILGRISAPEKVTLLSEKTVQKEGYTWQAIQLSNGKKGWIVSQFVKGARTASANTATSSRRRYIRGDKVNIRKDSSTSASIIEVLAEGAIVTLLSDKTVQNQGHQWAKIRLPNGEIGWVSTQFIGR